DLLASRKDWRDTHLQERFLIVFLLNNRLHRSLELLNDRVRGVLVDHEYRWRFDDRHVDAELADGRHVRQNRIALGAHEGEEAQLVLETEEVGARQHGGIDVPAHECRNRSGASLKRNIDGIDIGRMEKAHAVDVMEATLAG